MSPPNDLRHASYVNCIIRTDFTDFRPVVVYYVFLKISLQDLLSAGVAVESVHVWLALAQILYFFHDIRATLI
jgi:hypothetical protein